MKSLASFYQLEVDKDSLGSLRNYDGDGNGNVTEQKN